MNPKVDVDLHVTNAGCSDGISNSSKLKNSKMRKRHSCHIPVVAPPPNIRSEINRQHQLSVPSLKWTTGTDNIQKKTTTRLRFQKEKRSYAVKREQEGGNSLVEPLGLRRTSLEPQIPSLAVNFQWHEVAFFTPLLVSWRSHLGVDCGPDKFPTSINCGWH